MESQVAAVGYSETHTVDKPRRESIRLLADLGVEGDAHPGRTAQHRSRVKRDPTQPNLRQVHLIHAEPHDEIRAAGFDMRPGQMGENVTTRGVDLLGLPADTIMRLGDAAVIRITGLRNPCRQLDTIQPGLMAATLDRNENGDLVRKAGLMAVVVSEGPVTGVVRPGDPIVVERPAGPHIPLEPV